MWVDRVAAVGPGSAGSHTAAFVIGGCVTLPFNAGAAVHVGSVELDAFAATRDDGVEVDSAWPRRTGRCVYEMFLQKQVCELAIRDR